MSVKVRIDSIDRDIKLITDELLSPGARARQFAEGAKEQLADTDEINRQALGRVPKSETYVDGRRGAPLASVSANGVIIREYELVNDVLIWIAATLRADSVVGKGPDKRPGHPGFYRSSHVLFADGQEVDSSGQIPEAEEYVFLSTAPYARRVEKRTDIYEKTAAKANRRFGNVAKVSFGWRSPLIADRAAPAGRLSRHRARKAAQATRVPAIIVTMGR